MRMARDPNGCCPIVQGFGAGGFRVDGVTYRAVLLSPSTAELWSPPSLEALDVDMLAPLLDGSPEFLLLGTGQMSRAAPALMRSLDERAIGVEVMDSRAAARAWGMLRGEGRQIVAALYPFDA